LFAQKFCFSAIRNGIATEGKGGGSEFYNSTISTLDLAAVVLPSIGPKAVARRGAWLQPNRVFIKVAQVKSLLLTLPNFLVSERMQQVLQ
jgi:hypothetical protein